MTIQKIPRDNIQNVIRIIVIRAALNFSLLIWIRNNKNNIPATYDIASETISYVSYSSGKANEAAYIFLSSAGITIPLHISNIFTRVYI